MGGSAAAVIIALVFGLHCYHPLDLSLLSLFHSFCFFFQSFDVQQDLLKDKVNLDYDSIASFKESERSEETEETEDRRR